MSKLYDLLNSVIAKLKTTESSVPTKVSQLEQDVKTTWDNLEGRPFGTINNWNAVIESVVAVDSEYIDGDFSKLQYSNRGDPIAQEVRIVIDGIPYDTYIRQNPGYMPAIPSTGNATVIGGSEALSTLPDAPFFMTMSSVDGTRRLVFSFEDDGEHEVSIYYNTPETIFMDDQFIPSSIARTEDIPEPFSGSYNDLTDTPEIPEPFSGSYNDLTDTPEIPEPFSGSYNDLTDKPDIPEAFSGSYNDLTDTPDIPEHTWASLPDKPNIPTIDEIVPAVIEALPTAEGGSF